MSKPQWTYDGLSVGEAFTDSYVLTPGVVAQYVAATGDDHPWYTGPSPLGGPIAPPGLVAFLHYRLPRARYQCDGAVHAKHECDNLQPALVGTHVSMRGWLTDKYVKRGRACATVAFESHDEAGRLICRGRNTWVLRIDAAQTEATP